MKLYKATKIIEYKNRKKVFYTLVPDWVLLKPQPVKTLREGEYLKSSFSGIIDLEKKLNVGDLFVLED